MAIEQLVDLVVKEDEQLETQKAEDAFVVNEMEHNAEDLCIVEQEADMPDFCKVDVNVVPGSDTVFVEEKEQKAEDLPTTWEGDQDHKKFLEYIKRRVKNIPRHKGDTIPGCERASAYLKNLENEISKAMRTDFDGEIDEGEIDKVRKDIKNMIYKLELQIERLSKHADLEIAMFSDGHCLNCNSKTPMWHDVKNNKLVCMNCKDEREVGLKKEANTPKLNVYVSAFERACVGILINSHVSAGRNIEETYDHLKKKYAFTSREELAIQQLLADHGFPMFKDRGNIGEPVDSQSEETFDWATNYYA